MVPRGPWKHPGECAIHGGGQGNAPTYLRVSYRHANPPDIGLDMVGFRRAGDVQRWGARGWAREANEPMHGKISLNFNELQRDRLECAMNNPFVFNGLRPGGIHGDRGDDQSC